MERHTGAPAFNLVLGRLDRACVWMPEFGLLALDAKAGLDRFRAFFLICNEVDVRVSVSAMNPDQLSIELRPVVFKVRRCLLVREHLFHGFAPIDFPFAVTALGRSHAVDLPPDLVDDGAELGVICVVAEARRMRWSRCDDDASR